VKNINGMTLCGAKTTIMLRKRNMGVGSILGSTINIAQKE